MRIRDRIQHAWNALTSNSFQWMDLGPSSSRPTFRTVVSYSSAGFTTSIYNRIAIDVSMVKLRHVIVNPKNEDVKPVSSGLNYCLNTEANIDQNSIQFLHDVVYSMFDEGTIAIVPVETTINPSVTESYQINTLRVAKIVQWYPKHVTVRLYNELTGQNEDIIFEKKNVAIIENPLYAVMNDNNSTLKRLVNKINLLDSEDIRNSDGKLDLILSVPYSVRTQAQVKLVKDRLESIETQLSMGNHGISYIDATEKITQLNRPIESQLASRVEDLKKEFYNQLGLTETIFNGTASEEELRIYYSRTIDPILEHLVAELSRKFLTKTARTQGHEIQYNRNMFKFVTVEMLSTLIDTVKRNEVMTTNEGRKILGLRPSNDPRADELFNPNIADKNQTVHAPINPIGRKTETSSLLDKAKLKRDISKQTIKVKPKD